MTARAADTTATAGLLGALRAIGGTLNELVRVRGALFSLDLRDEVQRRKEMLILATLGAVFFHTALVLLTFLVVAVFWDSYRFVALGAMATLYLACGAVAFAKLRVKAGATPAPFAATLHELDQDLAQLRPSP